MTATVVCDIPLGPLADDAPLYERPYLSQDEYKAWAKVAPLGDMPESTDIAADLLKLMASPASPAGAGSGSNMTARSAPTPSRPAATPRWSASTAREKRWR